MLGNSYSLYKSLFLKNQTKVLGFTPTRKLYKVRLSYKKNIFIYYMKANQNQI
jgi:hypothetical protein